MFTLFMWPFCPNLQDPKAPKAPIYAAELRSTARGQPNFRPSAADSARTDPSLPEKSHSTVFHMVLTATALSWMIWSSGAIRYQTNITSCMPRRPRHFPICLKPIKGMSLTTSQAVSVTLLYRLHDDALMSKTKEFLQPH